MINTLEHVKIHVEVKKQIVYLNGEDVGFIEFNDGSLIVGVLGPNKDDPRFRAADVPQAIRYILGHALFGMEYFEQKDINW